MRRLLIIAWLMALWIVLWRDLSLANLASGLLVALFVGVTVSLEWAGGDRGRHRVRPLALVAFLVYFAWKLIESNMVVARAILSPRSNIQTGIIAVPMAGCSDMVVTVVANAVSLTPGTLTLEARGSEPAELYVHVLQLHDVERSRRDVATLARLARRALQRDVGSDPEAEEAPR